MFSELLSRYSTSINPMGLILALLLAVVMGYGVSGLYLSVVRSPDKALARLFPLLSAGLALASTLLSSSLGIALALVGALSVIRFRNVTPNLEQASFLFLTIGLGLSVGVGHFWMALLALGLIAPCMAWFFYRDRIRPSSMQLSMVGEVAQIESRLTAIESAIPDLTLVSLEQEGSRGTYCFTFTAATLDQLLPLREQLSTVPGLQYSFSEQDED